MISSKKRYHGFGRAISASDSLSGIDMDFELTDEKAAREVLRGKLRGLSVEAKIRWVQCSICGKNYEDCEHEKGKVYNGKVAYRIARGVKFEGLSLVEKPDDKTARITDMLIVEETSDKIRYEWNAFSGKDHLERTEKLKRAHKQSYISGKALTHFLDFFGRFKKGVGEFTESR